MPQSIRKVLIAYKKPPSRGEEVDQSQNGLPSSHRACMDVVQQTLLDYGIQPSLHYREDLPPVVEGVDLALSVGGDGTFLDLAHRVRDGRIPVLGINSNPSQSVGFYCATDKDRFKETLDGIVGDRLPSVLLTRILVHINDTPLPLFPLNEALVTHPCPGATSRYSVTLGVRQEVQRSSGLWVSTASGSSAGIRSAGGKVMPLGSRRLQFKVREPTLSGLKPPSELLHGYIDGHPPMEIQWLRDLGALFVDGPHQTFPLVAGDRIRLAPCAPRLRVLGFNLLP